MNDSPPSRPELDPENYDGDGRYVGPERRADHACLERRILYVVLTAFAVVVIWTAQQNRARTLEGRQAHAALCVFKIDLQRRAAQTAEFLRTHPNGIPGITGKTLQQSLTNQIATIRSLDRLRCSPATPPSVTVTHP